MKRTNAVKWLTRLAWSVIAVDLLLVFALPGHVGAGNLLFIVGYSAYLVLSLLGCSTWLMIRHRRVFRTWIGWAVPIALWALSSAVFQDVIPVQSSSLMLFFSLLLIASGWALVLATCLFLWHRDAGLALVGWGTLALVWGLLIGWRVHGNLVELWLSMLDPSASASPIWWLNTVICVAYPLLPLGVLGFVGHTVRLLVQEYRSPGQPRAGAPQAGEPGADPAD